MITESMPNEYLSVAPVYQSFRQDNPPEETDSDNKTVDNTLDDFVFLRGKILKSKLEILASEITDRFQIRKRNRNLMEKDEEKVWKLLHPYHIPSHRDSTSLYERVFDLKRESRDEDVKCWSDVVMVMRDFLNTWEAFEQARARSDLIRHV